MKKLYTRLMMLAMTALMLTGCSGGDNYTNAIPDDALLIQYIDGAQIAKKAGLSTIITPEQRASFADVAAIEVGGEDGEFLKQVILNLDNSGIDTEAPVYSYLDFEDGDFDEPLFAVVTKVCNKAQIDRLLSIAVKAGADIDRSAIEDFAVAEIDNTLSIGYNEDTFIAVISDWGCNRSTTLREAIYSAKNKRTKALPDFGSADWAMYINMVEFLNAIQHSEPYLVAQIEQAKEWIGESYQMMSLTFTNGHITMKHKVDNLPAKTEELYDGMLGSVDNDYLKYLPKEVLAASNININGKELLEKLLNVDNIRQSAISLLGSQRELDKNVAMIRPYVESFVGDITFALTALKESNRYYGSNPDVEFLAMANVKGESVLSAMTMLANGDLTPTGDKEYEVDAGSETGYVGQIDDMFYIGMETKPYEYSTSAADAKWMADLSDADYYAVINLQALFSSPYIAKQMRYEIDDDRVMRMLTDTFDYAYIRNGDGFETIFDVTLVNKDKNSLRVIGDAVKPFVMQAVNEVM